MARYITPELREQIEEAESGTSIRVALVPSEGASDGLNQRANQYDLQINRKLPSGVIIASASADVLEDFLDAPEIGSASKPNRAEILN